MVAPEWLSGYSGAVIIKVLCVAGARPNFPKIAPLMRAFNARPEQFQVKLVNTGQHYDEKLAKVFFEDLAIPRPDMNLEVGSASHAVQTAEIMKRFETVIQAENPHVVIVVGDVNSTAGCALVTAKHFLPEEFRFRGKMRKRPVMVHVEAGLRSLDDDTKFHQICRGPSIGSPPRSIIRAAFRARMAMASPGRNTSNWPSPNT